MADDHEVAIEAVSAGMRVLAAIRGSDIERAAKEGDDFVTSADLDAERAIRSVISAHRPHDQIIGEELGGDLIAFAGDARRWLIDPLCGTRNFASGAGDYCVNVAVRAGQAPLSAAVGDPRNGHVYWSDTTGAWLRNEGRDQALRSGTANRIIEINADGKDSQLEAAFLADPRVRNRMSPRVSGTTLSLAWVASGARAAYLSDGDIVDDLHFAAGIDICRAAGCIVSDLEGRSLGTGRGLVIAADLELFPELHRLL